MIGLIMFFVCLVMLLFGFPVAFTFAGISVLFALFSPEGIMLFELMPYRIMSIMENTILVAVPLFVFMGMMLQKTQLADELLESLNSLLSNVRGGLALSTIFIGVLLAASTGVVGASVVVMGVIALPAMLKHQVNKRLATGVICASGTLGQIVPPSIVLIILADVVNLPVGDLFQAAVYPALTLIFGYLVYVTAYSYYHKVPIARLKKQMNPREKWRNIMRLMAAIIPPLFLIFIVLGSILSGIATPTESASLGAMGAVLLAFLHKKFNLQILKISCLETAKITAMIFTILIGATAFSMVFSYTGGDVFIENIIHNMPAKEWVFIIISMLLIFILGFFIDFIEIALIVVPILYPIAHSLGIDMTWFAVLIAINLQTSFLTPPFGFSLFYLKGVAPKSIVITDIYKGVIPFIIIQIIVLLSITVTPSWYGLSAF